MTAEMELILTKLDSLSNELLSIKEKLEALNMHSPPLSLQKAASYLHLSKSRVYYLVNNGQLKPLQHCKGGRILFSKETLNQYLYENKTS